MTRANLYYYFSSKDELLRETLSATLRRYRQNWSTVPDGATLSELAEHMVSLRYQEVARSGPMDLRFFYLLLTDQAGEREAEMVRAEIEMAPTRSAASCARASAVARSDPISRSNGSHIG